MAKKEPKSSLGKWAGAKVRDKATSEAHYHAAEKMKGDAFDKTDSAQSAKTAEAHKEAADAHRAVAKEFSKAAAASPSNAVAMRLNNSAADHNIIANSHESKADDIKRDEKGRFAGK